MSLPVKILIAEPSVIVRSGVVSVLRRLASLSSEVFEVGEGDQLRQALVWHRPDVLVVGSALGSVSPAQWRKEVPGLRCVALQTALTDSLSLKGYDEVISLYDSAEAIHEKFTRLISAPQEDRRHESLTQREKEVIVCVIEGMTNKQIADKLFLSTHTVVTHRRNIASKLGIHSTAGLTIYAIVNKLVDLGEIQG